jgi:ribosomal protein S18 acetylase RimI-like enzyme
MSVAEISTDEIFDRRRACSLPRKAAGEDLATVAGVLSRAFEKDPVFDWILRADRKRDAARATFFEFFVNTMGSPSGELWVSQDGSAAAAWMPPAQGNMNLSVIQELLLLPKLIFMTGGTRMGRIAKLREALAKQHPKSPDHWYLAFIGVEPTLHGKGLGSALLEANLARVDEWGLPAYLEASSRNNVRLYQRHGFHIRQEFRAAPDAPPMWAMWREPQKR